MNNEIDVIQKDPLTLRVAFNVQWANTLFFQRLFDVIGDCLIMACRSSSTDEEIIGERRNVSEFEYHCILRLFIECRFYCFG